ncbi:MAG: GAF domain-containing protein [Desulfobulbus sp.]|nr:GAF domain-containing protein [Desulfobulbus sp.]
MQQSREQQFLEIFQKVIRLTSKVYDHQEVMDTIVQALPSLLSIDACTIRLHDASIGSFVLGAAHGVSMEYLSREVIDTDETLNIARSGYPVYSTHVDEDQYVPFREEASREGIKSVLTLPIAFQEELIGIMRLLTRDARSFSTEEISFAMALAEQVGIAISHGHIFKEMAAQLGFLHEIQEISTLVNSTLDLKTVLDGLVERVVRTMAAKGCTLRLIEPESGHLNLAAAYGVSEAYLQRGEVEQERNIQMVLAGDPVAIYDVSHDHRIDYHHQMALEGIVSLLAVPVKVNKGVIGVMRILTGAPRVFTDTEVRFAMTLAEVGGTALRNARNYQQIHLLVGQIQGHEQFLSNILNNLHHQLVVLNQDRRLVLANQAFLDTLQVKEEDILGMDYDRLCSSHESDRPCPVDQILAGQEMRPFVQECRLGEQPRWFERSASPIMGEDGQVEYVVEIIRDITSEHMLAVEKMQSSRLQGIVELAGTVAHEINSPLFAALGTAQLLAEDHEQTELGEELAVIIRNLKQIGELTGKMTSMTGFSSQEYVGTRNILSFKQ